MFKVKFDEPAHIEAADDNYLTFSNGYKISTYHHQECCENVYAEFSCLEVEISIKNKTKFNGIDIKTLDTGFLVNNILINSYNEQNGYYGDGLTLSVFKSGECLFELEVGEGNINVWLVEG